MGRKSDLQEVCDKLGIKYQENDTIDMLEAALAGHQARQDQETMKPKKTVEVSGTVESSPKQLSAQQFVGLTGGKLNHRDLFYLNKKWGGIATYSEWMSRARQSKLIKV